MRLFPALVWIVPALAFAADPPVDEVIRTSPRVVLEVSDPGTCARSWEDPIVRTAAEQAGVRTLRTSRTKEAVATWVGDAYTPGTLRLAYVDGQEADRLCGCVPSQELADWLADLGAGRTHADRLRAAAQSPPRDVVPIGTWIEVAQAERCADRLDDAYQTLVSLWDRIPVDWPEQRALRLSRVASELGALAVKHPPARDALVALRDGLETAKDTEVDANDEWVALNRILRDDARTLGWYGAARQDPARVELARRQAPNVFQLWIEAGRWAEAGGLIDDVDGWLAVWRAQPQPDEGAVRGYAALRSADRAKDAAALAKAVLRQEGAATQACAMLARSVQVGVAGKDERAVAKACDDPAVVAAWTAALP